MEQPLPPKGDQTSWPIKLDGTVLWVAKSRGGILKRLFATKLAAAIEADEHDRQLAENVELLGWARYAATVGNPSPLENWFAVEVEDLDGVPAYLVVRRDPSVRWAVGGHTRDKDDAAGLANEFNSQEHRPARGL
jgi:hypothetical protein